MLHLPDFFLKGKVTGVPENPSGQGQGHGQETTGGPECDVRCAARHWTNAMHLFRRQDKMQRQIVAPADVLRARENARRMLHLPEDLNAT
jgi:hypothetical protein